MKSASSAMAAFSCASALSRTFDLSTYTSGLDMIGSPAVAPIRSASSPLVNPPNLNRTVARIGDLRRPLDRGLDRFHLDQEVARKGFFALGNRAVRNRRCPLLGVR